MLVMLARARHRQTLVTEFGRRVVLAAVQNAVALHLLWVPVHVVVAVNRVLELAHHILLIGSSCARSSHETSMCHVVNRVIAVERRNCTDTDVLHIHHLLLVTRHLLELLAHYATVVRLWLLLELLGDLHTLAGLALVSFLVASAVEHL
jgi:hypothetical protein